ncbi:hypothetical protein CF326_g10073 [Tilletia indica]|nr:hypothetical protein CF326_g10073 [Tilletia indica]
MVAENSSSPSPAPSASSPSRGAAAPQNIRLTEAALDVQMRESVLRTLNKATEIRPHNTNRNYQPKQDEFKKWCEEKGWDEMSRYQVTSQKLHLFLEERVISRAPKRAKKSKNDKGDAPKTLAESTVRLYVAAIIDLYTQQRAKGVNSSLHPRAGPVAILLNTRKLEERVRKKREYVDRGIGECSACPSAPVPPQS